MRGNVSDYTAHMYSIQAHTSVRRENAQKEGTPRAARAAACLGRQPRPHGGLLMPPAAWIARFSTLAGRPRRVRFVGYWYASTRCGGGSGRCAPEMPAQKGLLNFLSARVMLRREP